MAADRAWKRPLVVTRTQADLVDQIQSAKNVLRRLRRELSAISRLVAFGDISTSISIPSLSRHLVHVIQDLHTLLVDIQATDGTPAARQQTVKGRTR
jgi:hypothetical protein